MSFVSKLGRFWLVLLFAAVCGYVAITNSKDTIALRLPPFFETMSLPVYLWLGIAFLCGAAAAAFYFAAEHLRRGFKIRRLEKRLAELAPPINIPSPAVTRDASTMKQEPHP